MPACGGAMKRPAMMPGVATASVASTGGYGAAEAERSSTIDDAAPVPDGANLYAGQPGEAVVAPAPTRAVREEALVVQGNLTLEVDDVVGTVELIRQQVDGMGGRIVNESVSGSRDSVHGTLVVRLPPARVDELLAVLDGSGEIVAKNIVATDVSKTLFDQEIALENLERTLARLRALLDTGGLAMADILNIEKEMTRLRGQIEAIKGEQRYLRDRVALATLTLTIRMKTGVTLDPEAKIYPGARFSTLVLLDDTGGDRTRLGGGFVVHLGVPRTTLELDIFAAPDGGEERGITATIGGAMYSDFFDRGRRSFLNPYLGLRIGYADIDGPAFTVMGDAGVELFKHERFMVDANVRALGFFGSGDADSALVFGAGAVFAF